MSSAAVTARPAPRRLRTDVLTMLTAKGFGLVLNAAGSVTVARYLGPTGRGSVAVAFSLTMLLAQLGSAGFTVANPYFIAREPTIRSHVVANSLWLAAVLGSGLLVLGFLLRIVAPATVQGLDLLQLVIVLVGIPLTLSTLFLHSILLGEGRIRAYNGAELAISVFVPVALLVGFAVFHMGVIGALVLMVAGQLAGTVTYLSLLRSDTPRRLTLDTALLGRMARYAVRVYLGTLVAFLLIRIDLLLVNAYLGTKQAGYYSVAVAMGNTLYIVPTVIATNLFARIARGGSNEMSAEVFRSVAVLYGLLCLAVIPIAGGVLHFLYGPAFAPASPLFYWLLPGIFSLGMINLLAQHFAGRGFPTEAILVWIPGLVLDVGLNMTLLTHNGTYIASLASSISYTLILLLHMRMFAKEAGSYRVLVPNPAELARFVINALRVRGRALGPYCGDFNTLWSVERDPWAIGDARSDRYDHYRDLLLAAAERRGSLLDVGCGSGAFLARFRDDFDELTGIDVAPPAIDRGTSRFPFVNFLQGSAARLDETALDARRFDAIVYSDVIYYLGEQERKRSLDWIAKHLNEDGVALIAAWAPGGAYPDPDELERLIGCRFAIESMQTLESEHAVFILRRRRCLVALTVDYETWQPIPDGRRVDWEVDVFQPTGALLDACDRYGATVTLFAEMGEYLWLTENAPDLASRMRSQWQDAVRRGHDVQLHLHPAWLPELGARCEQGQWWWDEARSIANAYPGDLTAAVRRCKQTLEDAIRPVAPEYAVTCFRAGAYEAQPFTRLHEALVANGIRCDSSVHAGGRKAGRSYDYSLAYSRHQPYFAARHDPQLEAPPAERTIVELPIFAYEWGQRWTFDGDEGHRFAARLLEQRKQDARDREPTGKQLRRSALARKSISSAYRRLRRVRPLVNRVLPRRIAYMTTTYEHERPGGHDHYVLVGHTKSDLDVPAIAAGLAELARASVEFLSLSEMASLAERGLARTARDAFVSREQVAATSIVTDEAHSARLQRLIPRHRRRVLEIGCATGNRSREIAETLPWASVTGIDLDESAIAAARCTHASARVDFRTDDITARTFADASFDCVYADHSLQGAIDVDRTLAQIHRVLEPGGVLVAAVSSDARNPQRVCSEHAWKTMPADVHARLAIAGFVDIEIEEIDGYRDLGMPPFPPSNDQIMHVRAWKRTAPATDREQAIEITRWVYRALDPERPSDGEDPWQILAGGYAWCSGYTRVLNELLRRAGYETRWVTMLAEEHPRGRGELKEDTHEVLEVTLADGSVCVADATAGVWFDTSIAELTADPALADTPRECDERYRARGYDLYATSFWYSRVRRVAFRPGPGTEHRFQAVEQVAARASRRSPHFPDPV
jgi:O-antigen/teichoic acid export membrane protein/SAM-dependent methyltransferase